MVTSGSQVCAVHGVPVGHWPSESHTPASFKEGVGVFSFDKEELSIKKHNLLEEKEWGGKMG